MEQGKRKRKGRQWQRWLRYRLSATVNRHNLSLSLSRRFPATITEPWKSHSSPYFFFFLPALPFHSFTRMSLLSFATRFFVVRVYILEKFCACFPIGPLRLTTDPRDLLPFLSSPVEIIRKIEVFLPWRKVRFARRSRGLGGRSEDAKSAYNERLKVTLRRRMAKDAPPATMCHMYVHAHVYVHRRRIFPKGPFRVN